jgi:LPS O-antigen subunit length determinant protein (WzzB/FepE family)
LDNIVENEIDLRDLFKIIWDKKRFIIIFTLLVTIIVAIYISTKKSIYEVKSVVRIGYINNVLLDDSDILVQKLKLIYNVDTSSLSSNKAIVSNIKTVKKLENFIEIYTQGYSNKDAEILNNKIIKFIKEEYKYKIDDYKYIIETNIKNFNKSVLRVKNIEKNYIVRSIKKIREQNILNIDNKISYINTIEVKKITEKIDFIKKHEITAKNEKLTFYEKKLNEYEKNVKIMTTSGSINNTADLLKGMQLSTLQNIILNVQNNITNLKVEKEKLINITLKDLEIKKKNLIDIRVRDLIIKKDNLIKDNIEKLNNDLNITIPNKIIDIENKINFEKTKLKNIKNSELVGSLSISDNPIKPKKTLIIVVSFITSFIMAIFLVFLMNFISNNKQD